MSTFSSHGGDRRVRFRNRICRCGVRAEVAISESANSRGCLYFKCRERRCNFFAWGVMDSEYFPLEMDGDDVSSSNFRSSPVSNVDPLHVFDKEFGDMMQKMNDMVISFRWFKMFLLGLLVLNLGLVLFR